MSSVYHSRRMGLLSQLGGDPKTIAQLAAESGLCAPSVNKLLIHKWFEVISLNEKPRRWQLSDEGRTVWASAPDLDPALDLRAELKRLQDWFDREAALVRDTGTGSTEGELIDEAVRIKAVLAKARPA